MIAVTGRQQKVAEQQAFIKERGCPVFLGAALLFLGVGALADHAWAQGASNLRPQVFVNVDLIEGLGTRRWGLVHGSLRDSPSFAPLESYQRVAVSPDPLSPPFAGDDLAREEVSLLSDAARAPRALPPPNYPRSAYLGPELPPQALAVIGRKPRPATARSSGLAPVESSQPEESSQPRESSQPGESSQEATPAPREISSADVGLEVLSTRAASARALVSPAAEPPAPPPQEPTLETMPDSEAVADAVASLAAPAPAPPKQAEPQAEAEAEALAAGQADEQERLAFSSVPQDSLTRDLQEPARTQGLAPQGLAPQGLESIFLGFAPGSNELTREARAKLDDFAQENVSFLTRRWHLRAYAPSPEGYTGNARRLALNRALTVRGYLQGKGLSAGRFEIRALARKDQGALADSVEITPQEF